MVQKEALPGSSSGLFTTDKGPWAGHLPSLSLSGASMGHVSQSVGSKPLHTHLVQGI